VTADFLGQLRPEHREELCRLTCSTVGAGIIRRPAPVLKTLGVRPPIGTDRPELHPTTWIPTGRVSPIA
jgi:hypothetical protein